MENDIQFSFKLDCQYQNENVQQIILIPDDSPDDQTDWIITGQIEPAFTRKL